MRFVPGPDFPTGGLIYGRARHRAGVPDRPRQHHHARAHRASRRSPGSGDREQIVVTEIPYQVNKARLHAKIGELMRDKRIEGIAEVRDESDRDGMRLVIELKKDVFPQVVLNQLYRLTDLQTSFGVINLVDRRRPSRRPRPEGDARSSSSSTAATWSAAARASSCARPRPSARSSRAWAWRPPRSTSWSRPSAQSRDPEIARDAPDGAAAQGPRGVRAPRRSARGGDRRGRRRRATTSSPSVRPRPSSRCASRGSPASSKRSSPRSTASSAHEIARLRASSRTRSVLMDVIVDGARGGQGEVRRQAPHRDRRQRGRDPDRGPDPGRGHGRHHLARRLHQAHAASRPTARRSAAARARSAWRRATRTSSRQLFVASTHCYVFFFSRPRQGLREEGLRDPASRRATPRAARS